MLRASGSGVNMGWYNMPFHLASSSCRSSHDEPPGGAVLAGRGSSSSSSSRSVTRATASAAPMETSPASSSCAERTPLQSWPASACSSLGLARASSSRAAVALAPRCTWAAAARVGTRGSG
eukprot:4455235-Prymnesium_polylepis.1